jgi:hypothetical protein
MELVPAIILCATCTLTCARVLLFRRCGLRYRWHVSALAWVLAASTGSVALRVMLGHTSHVSWGEAGIGAVMCILTYIARGNVAHILRPNHETRHPAPR